MTDVADRNLSLGKKPLHFLPAMRFSESFEGFGELLQKLPEVFFVLALVRASEPHVRQGFERFASSLDTI
ncbi:hypothetical protein F1Z41_08125 [Clostridium perfringens]|nr:hypothetical protein [Clostridium perfringens]